MDIDVWSDIACPWCYVGKRRLEAALVRFPRRDQVKVTWHSFQLDPSQPRIADGDYVERLGRKYGTNRADAQAMIDRMTGVAAADGLDFHFERICPGNTFDAHRLLHLAHQRGRQDAVKERFFRGYLTEGAPIGDPETLARLAIEAGLGEEEVRTTLASDAYAREVRVDEEQARALGIRGVPFFVFGRRLGVSGAQPADTLLEVLQQALPAPIPEGEVCGPEGCT